MIVQPRDETATVTAGATAGATAAGADRVAAQPLALARAGVDRAAEHRLDEPWLAAAWSHPDTRVLLVAEGQAFVIDTDTGSELVLLPSFETPEEGERYFLGTDAGGVSYFAVSLDSLPGRLDGDARPAGLREVGGLLGDRDSGLLVHAVALQNWHRSHRFCSRCGHPTAPAAAGHVRRCTSCAHEHYPRTDAAVIMLVTDGQDRALLGRQALWPEGRYSTLAGFVEPGEALEQAVAREVAEEAGVRVDPGTVTYVASQPWPFPASLMLGFLARAEEWDGGTDITVDGEELSAAAWFSREELRDGMADGTVLPPSGISIARRLVEIWYGGPLPESARW